MAGTFWAIHHADGTFEQVISDKRPKATSASVFRLDRPGDLVREQHIVGKGWVPRAAEQLLDAEDAAFDVDYPGARAIEYAVKEIEARIILGTLSTDGRLAREAQMRGVSVDDLARAVVERADSDVRSTRRIDRKLKIKAV